MAGADAARLPNARAKWSCGNQWHLVSQPAGVPCSNISTAKLSKRRASPPLWRRRTCSVLVQDQGLVVILHSAEAGAVWSRRAATTPNDCSAVAPDTYAVISGAGPDAVRACITIPGGVLPPLPRPCEACTVASRPQRRLLPGRSTAMNGGSGGVDGSLHAQAVRVSESRLRADRGRDTSGQPWLRALIVSEPTSLERTAGLCSPGIRTTATRAGQPRQSPPSQCGPVHATLVARASGATQVARDEGAVRRSASA